ncbi:MAG: hypothetical protein V2J07_00625, partial [Anaerolineae bacterium]|nr:hypothetical protein [Anaerolineae bacterium]
FTPEHGNEEPREIWYLFGAWMLAATMNASLTWWGVSMAITNHTIQSTAIIEAGKIIQIVPIFVAILVWVIRVLVIGSISSVGERLLWGATAQPTARKQSPMVRPAFNRQPATTARRAAPNRSNSGSYFSATRGDESFSDPVRIQSATAFPHETSAVPRESGGPRNPRYTSSEPTYHSLNGLGNEVEGQSTQTGRRV